MKGNAQRFSMFCCQKKNVELFLFEFSFGFSPKCFYFSFGFDLK